MAELRALVASLGHTNVRTYIQSGNLLFIPSSRAGGADGAADPPTVAAEMEHAIIARLGVLRHEQGADTASGFGIALVLEPAFTSLQIDDEPVTL